MPESDEETQARSTPDPSHGWQVKARQRIETYYTVWDLCGTKLGRQFWMEFSDSYTSLAEAKRRLISLRVSCPGGKFAIVKTTLERLRTSEAQGDK